MAIAIVSVPGLEKVFRTISGSDESYEGNRLSSHHPRIGNRIAILLVLESLISSEIIEIGVAAIEA